jgi:tetratricopeptide (TPR) repeat protein
MCEQNLSSDECRERLILQLHTQVGLYRSLGDEYQATRCIWEIREQHLPAIVDPRLRNALEGFTDANEGTLQYRRGEYGRLLEYYLQDELSVGRERFDLQFPWAREGALHLLQRGEGKLQDTLRVWEASLDNAATKADASAEHQKLLRDRLKRHRKNLGEARFRLGELFMLNQQFDSAFRYLHLAIQDARESGDTYRYDNAIQSYLNALYFSGKYDDADSLDERRRYEQELRDTRADPRRMHPSIVGRFRVIQGDALFSKCFQGICDKRTGHVHYIPREDTNIRQIRIMLRYYVEACEYMAQHSQANFAAAVRVLLRRIQLLADRNTVQIIQRGLSSVWKDQPHLKKGKELDTLLQLTAIRSMTLG